MILPLNPNREVEMPISAVSHYRGGTPETVRPLSRKMQAILLKHGVQSYRVGRYQTGQSVGDWMVVVQYADWTSYAKVHDSLAQDPEHGKAVAEISQIVQIVSREFVADLDF
jgi:hypothetical protein